MTEPVVVSAPSRLHFGLLRFAQSHGPSFGGLGMMIAAPRAIVELAAADCWSAEGPSADRALALARRALESTDAATKLAALRVVVRSVVPPHRGLGGGTQLALAVAAGVRRALDLPAGTAEELATAVGRGERSAVGSHGFVHGGLVWETGRWPGEPLGRLASRVALPVAWRVVLVAPRDVHGLSGKPEREAFEALPAVPEATAARLQQLAEGQILPAAERGAVDDFGEGVFEYGRLAGNCFAPVQGGPYSSAEIAGVVTAIRALGMCGVGQSSWGPTVFAIVDGESRARELATELRARPQWSGYDFTIVAPDNRGATVSPAFRTAPR